VKQNKIWLILRDVLIVAVLTGLGGFILGFGAIVRATPTIGNVQGVPLRQRAQQEANQHQIYALNEDVMSKSNILQRILSPQSPYKIEQYHYRTNVTERLKDLIEGKKANASEKDPWRKFDGHSLFISTDRRFKYHTGKIIQTTSEGILFDEAVGFNLMRMAPDYTKTVFVKHYPYVVPDDSAISFYAVETEPYQYTSILGATKVVEALDYGMPCSRPKNADEVEAAALRVTPEDEQQIHDDAAAAAAQLSAAQTDLEIAREKLRDFMQELKDEREAPSKEAQKQVQEKALAAKNNALKFNQDQAAKGDSIGLQRMGERYRDGDGVPKDLDKARDYFEKAQKAGNFLVDDELKKLNQMSTNSPTRQ
jgi:hypothetical protein